MKDNSSRKTDFYGVQNNRIDRHKKAHKIKGLFYCQTEKKIKGAEVQKC